MVIFSVLLSKDRQTGAVGNGRLFPHFFWGKKKEEVRWNREEEKRQKATYTKGKWQTPQLREGDRL